MNRADVGRVRLYKTRLQIDVFAWRASQPNKFSNNVEVL